MTCDILDAVIIGAGPAGLLAGRALELHGLSVLNVDPNYGNDCPQSEHVHFFSRPALNTIDSWLPGFRDGLLERGTKVADAHGRQADARTGRLWPSRRSFDRALRECYRPRLAVRRERVPLIGYRRGTWMLSGLFGSLRCRLLIDASGRSRCTLNRIGHLSAEPVVINEGPATGSYLSCIVGDIRAPESQLVVRLRGDDHEASLLALRLGDNRWQITIALPPASTVRSWEGAILALPAKSRTFFEGHRRIGGLHRYGGQRSSFLVSAEGATPPGWLPLGDALFTSPPYQGNGVANLVEQIRRLNDAFRSERSFEGVRNSIFELASSAWLRATLLDTLSNPACLAGQATSAPA